MRSRGSRIYVLLAIMAVIMFFSIIIDMTVDKTSDNTEPIANTNSEENNNIENETVVVSEEETETTTLLVLSEEQEKQVERFYKNTVFVGDSIMSGFETYAGDSGSDAPEFVRNLIFLAARSYGVDAALTGSKLAYKGESRTLIENLEIINPDKIFINLGVNELDGVPAEKIGEKYGELIKQIREKLPDTGIYIMGVTYFVEGKETDTYNNNGIRVFNDYLKSHSSEWVVTYLDLPSKLSNEKGYLPLELASDGRIHQNYEAYRIWVSFLEEIAINY